MQPQKFSPEQEAVVESISANTVRAFESLRTASREVELIRKLDFSLDNRIKDIQRAASGFAQAACKPGCEHCCYVVVKATIPEVAGVSAHIEANFSAGQKTALQERLYNYERAVAPNFGLNLDDVRTPCPLLVDGLCSVYEARPLRCRGQNSLDAGVCERKKLDASNREPLPVIAQQYQAASVVKQGLKTGLFKAHINGEDFDFGRALAIALDDPDAVQRFFDDGHVFLPALSRSAGDTEKHTVFDEETLNQGIADQFRLYEEGDTKAALDALKGSSPAVMVRRILVPRFYSSEEEIGYWRERAVKAVRDLGAKKMDPFAAFSAIRGLETFELAYQQLNDRQIMSELGEILVHKVTAMAFPDLTQPMEKRKSGGKLRVGYISRNLSASNGGSWALGWLKNHAEDIETYAFFIGERQDEVTTAFKQCAGKFFHMTEDVPRHARFIKSLELDVLVYPDLGMDPFNHQYATMRLAPVQCTAWGHPVTSGLPTIDYYLSSELMEPADAQDHYTEKLVRLPGTGLFYEKKGYPTSRLVKGDFGLDDGPLFLCCQNPMKLHPRWDFLYREIGRRAGRPIVFTKYTFKNVTILQERMKRAGVDAIWIPTVTASDFSGLLSLADVSLDTPGWNGGNTTIQALSMGIPVITLPGDYMRGRHTLAFLEIANAIGLIARNAEDYIELALNKNGREESIANSTPERLFVDTRPVEALDAFLRLVT